MGSSVQHANHDVQILISPKLMTSLFPSKQYWLVLYLQNGLPIRKLWLLLNQQKIEERPKMPNISIVCFFAENQLIVFHIAIFHLRYITDFANKKLLSENNCIRTLQIKELNKKTMLDLFRQDLDRKPPVLFDHSCLHPFDKN